MSDRFLAEDANVQETPVRCTRRTHLSLGAAKVTIWNTFYAVTKFAMAGEYIGSGAFQYRSCINLQSSQQSHHPQPQQDHFSLQHEEGLQCCYVESCPVLLPSGLLQLS